MLKLLTVFLLGFLVSQVFAQNEMPPTFRGVLVSGFTGRPIAGATVTYAQSKATVSDSLGQFFIPIVETGQLQLSFSAQGYERKDTVLAVTEKDENLTWTIHTKSCTWYSRQTALQYIKKGMPVLLINDGDGSVLYPIDKHFKKKYKISLGYFGTVNEKVDCVLAHNQAVFEYLDKKLGRKWRTDVRKDIAGFVQ